VTTQDHCEDMQAGELQLSEDQPRQRNDEAFNHDKVLDYSRCLESVLQDKAAPYRGRVISDIPRDRLKDTVEEVPGPYTPYAYKSSRAFEAPFLLAGALVNRQKAAHRAEHIVAPLPEARPRAGTPTGMPDTGRARGQEPDPSST
jgi:hypothetical protein